MFDAALIDVVRPSMIFRPLISIFPTWPISVKTRGSMAAGGREPIHRHDSFLRPLQTESVAWRLATHAMTWQSWTSGGLRQCSTIHDRSRSRRTPIVRCDPVVKMVDTPASSQLEDNVGVPLSTYLHTTRLV